MSLFRKTITAFLLAVLVALVLSPGARAGIGDGIKALEDAFGGPVVGQGATDGQTLTWDDTQKRWEPADAGAGSDNQTLQEVTDEGATTDTQIVSTLATGTSPFQVASTTVVTNLNADLLDGESAAAFQDADTQLTEVAAVTGSNDQFLGGNGSGVLAMRTASQVRASLVLATTDSPTFAGLTLSAATSGSGTATTVGFLLTTEDVTAGSGAPNVLTAAESGKVITNEGVTAQAYNTLPAAAAGLCFTFVVSDADGIRIAAAGDDTIRVLSLVSPAAGYTESTTIGSTIHVVAISATKWIAVSAVGTWTVSS